jgi:hypothetical protein
MTVCAADYALVDFRFDSMPRVSVSDQIRHIRRLLSRISVVELQDGRICFTTTDARVRPQVVHDQFAMSSVFSRMAETRFIGVVLLVPTGRALAAPQPSRQVSDTELSDVLSLAALGARLHARQCPQAPSREPSHGML